MCRWDRKMSVWEELVGRCLSTAIAANPQHAPVVGSLRLAAPLYAGSDI